jgi:hypothetical protein
MKVGIYETHYHEEFLHIESIEVKTLDTSALCGFIFC